MNWKIIVPIFIIGLIFLSGCSNLTAKSVKTDMSCNPGEESSDDASAIDIACRVKCELKNWEYTGNWKCSEETSTIVCYCHQR